MPVFGEAGGSLRDPSWLDDASTAKAGLAGERKTAAVLDRLAHRTGVTVLHDLTIPGSRANIDHIVVSGSTVTVLDSKTWKPGFYWTLGGRTRRGMELFPPADKRTLPFALDRLREKFEREGVRAKLASPLLVVWASKITWFFGPAGGVRLVRGADLANIRFGSKPADPHLVASLRALM